MSALAKRIKRAESIEVINACLVELQDLLALASKRIQEREAKEVDRRLDEEMWPGSQRLRLSPWICAIGRLPWRVAQCDGVGFN